MSLYQAKKAGNTEAGNKYIILQDSPKSFHVSVGINNHVIYEHFEDPPSLDFLEKNILLLEKELYSKINIEPT